MYKSIVEYFADKSGSRCGYCSSRDSSFSHGMWGHVLTCSDYQDLIDRGWRRSGRYCYKPTMDQTCCPQYTIKCDATQFQLTKSQKKILKKFRNFIIKGDDPPMTNMTRDSSIREHGSDSESDCSDDEDKEEAAMDVESSNQAKAEEVENQLRLDPTKNVQINYSSEEETSKDSTFDATDAKVESPTHHQAHCANVNANVKPGAGADPTKPKARKKKELRKEKALAKLRASGKTDEEFSSKKVKNEVKTLEDLTSTEFPSDAKHKFEIRLVSAQTSDATFNETYLDSFNVYKKYQMAVHKDSPSKCTLGQFKRFLCNASLVHTDSSRYGAFHQQYVIDGRIVAVGVVDILPNCISSVYLYYDPDFAFLSPGTLTSLFEIAFTKKLQRERPQLKYYYMGYYIHSCPKMRYKAKYHPSWLLCPQTYKWEPVKPSLLLLDKSKFAVLHSGDQDETKIKINESVVLFENQAMTFELYRSLNSVDDSEMQEVQEYAELVGSTLSKKILLYRGWLITSSCIG